MDALNRAPLTPLNQDTIPDMLPGADPLHRASGDGMVQGGSLVMVACAVWSAQAGEVADELELSLAGPHQGRGLVCGLLPVDVCPCAERRLHLLELTASACLSQ